VQPELFNQRFPEVGIVIDQEKLLTGTGLAFVRWLGLQIPLIDQVRATAAAPTNIG